MEKWNYFFGLYVKNIATCMILHTAHAPVVMKAVSS
jgi:hypothetical protein